MWPRGLFRRIGSQSIKSMQAGTITLSGSSSPLSGTATIAAVDPLWSYVEWGGNTWDPAGPGYNAGEYLCSLVALTDATTVTATVGSTFNPVDSLYKTSVVAFRVIEFFPGVVRSVRGGIIDITGSNLSATASLSPAVNPLRTSLRLNGWYGSVLTTDQGTHPKIVLTDGATVTASRATAAGSRPCSVGWSLVEFW